VINKKIQKILKELKSLKDSPDIKFAFSYIEMGKNLNELNGDVIHNIQDDLASETLMVIIESKLFETPNKEVETKKMIEEREVMAKLHMFNLFNKNKKFEA